MQSLIETCRRVFLPAVGAVLFGSLCAPPALAMGNLVKAQAPGYYRMMLGDFEVTAISDGTIDLPVGQLLNAPANKIKQALARSYLTDPVETSVNAYLINTGAKLVLIDAGTGSLFGPTLGKLVQNLQASGYQPDQVDEIYITHLHPDHVGGISADDKMLFPNAIVRVDKRDADHWLNEAKMNAAPKDQRNFFQGAIAAVKPYIAAGNFQPFDIPSPTGNIELTPGIRAFATRGHTPGHSVYVVQSGGQRLVLLGDLMHVGAVQFTDPSVTIKFDTDSKAAMPQRKKAFADAAKRGSWIGAAHLPFPGIGHLRAAGKGYDFVPVNYSVPK